MYWLLVSLCISTRFRFLMQQKVSLISSVEGYRLVFRDSGLVSLSEKKERKKTKKRKTWPSDIPPFLCLLAEAYAFIFGLMCKILKSYKTQQYHCFGQFRLAGIILWDYKIERNLCYAPCLVLCKSKKDDDSIRLSFFIFVFSSEGPNEDFRHCNNKKVITDVLYNSKFISFFFCHNSMHTRN